MVFNLTFQMRSTTARRLLSDYFWERFSVRMHRSLLLDGGVISRTKWNEKKFLLFINNKKCFSIFTNKRNRMKILALQFFSFITLASSACDSRLMVMMSRKQWNLMLFRSWLVSPEPPWNCRFIDVPIESCGMASPMRVALQATAPDILMILLRHGANACPTDGGVPPVLAVMDKLMEYEESGAYPYQLVSCLKILLLAVPYVELPFKVNCTVCQEFAI